LLTKKAAEEKSAATLQAVDDARQKEKEPPDIRDGPK
jgi:hypothetical protein